MRRARNAVKPLGGPRDPRHGTIAGYGYWGCRCGRCRAAATAKARDLRENGEVTNHNRWGYDRGCRCEVCREAKREDDQARNQARREWKATHRGGVTRTADLSKLA